MLQTIRDKAQGWFAWVLVIFITVPFALWGIQSYLGYRATPVKATVNGSEITEQEFEQSYRQFRTTLQIRMGKAYRPDLIDDAALRKDLLASLVRDELLRQAANRIGIRVSNQMVRGVIAEIPAFQVNGSFDQAAYTRALGLQRLSPEEFEAQMRRAIISEQMNDGIIGTAMVTPSELVENARLRWQTRDFDYLLFPAAGYLDKVQLDQGAVESYYQEHSQEFQQPEQVKVAYLDLNAAEIAATLKVDEQMLRDYYEQHPEEYLSPEQRRASHILISVPEGADEATVTEAHSKSEAVLQRIRNGESFAAVAKEVSGDPGSSAQGGDVGFFERGIMDQAFEDAAFKLAVGEISEPVRTQFGFHIIRLDEIRPRAGKPFEEIREQVRKAYLQNEVARLFYDYADQMANLTFENRDSLEPAAKALGLKVQVSDWIDRSGGEGIFSSAKIQNAAFSDEVLLQGDNSIPIEVEDERVVVLRVMEHREASIQPLETVQDEIKTVLRKQAAAAAAEQQGKELIIVLKGGGGSLAQLATHEDKEVHHRSGVARDDKEVPTEILLALFQLPHPAGDTPIFGGAVLDNGDYAVIALRGVTDGNLDDLGESEKEELEKGLGQLMGKSDYEHFVSNLQNTAEIVYPEAKGE